MEVDTINLEASGSENTEQPIAPTNTIQGKPIAEFTKVGVVAAKDIIVYHRLNISFRSA